MEKGIKVKDLKIGEIYKCQLSGEKVLTILSDKQTVVNADSSETHIEPKLFGKHCMKLDNGDYKYHFTELHDNQLVQLN